MFRVEWFPSAFDELMSRWLRAKCVLEAAMAAGVLVG